MRGVELVSHDTYSRTVRLGTHTGVVTARHVPARRVLSVELSHTLTPVLPALLTRLRGLFDLSARPDVISAHLMRDHRLSAIVSRNPGLRVPGAFDGFELATRAILGQQITVKGATTLAGRYIDAFGDRLEAPPDAIATEPEVHGGLTHLSPTAERIAGLAVSDIASLGIVEKRARAIVLLAQEIASGRLVIDPGADPDATIRQLVALPGIGQWTAHYIAMRALRWPDAFPKEDIALRKALGGATAARAEELSQEWRPWRSYATLHLWHGLPARDDARSGER
jgi:AraC family transcriptional regulator of adaptative response / DNA-3-methyladenine glycosylase II